MLPRDVRSWPIDCVKPETSDVVTDMNVLGTADVVNDMNVLGSSATVTAMNLLGTSAVVSKLVERLLT